MQRAGSLERIAKAGHVLSFINDPITLAREDGRMAPHSVGLNRASTFTGFCEFHDNALFRPIEAATFTASQEQCFLLAYRALSLEIYVKQAAIDLEDLNRSLDRGMPEVFQRAYQRMVSDLHLGFKLGLRDLDALKSRLDEMLINKDYTGIRAFVVELDGPLPMMSSGHFIPEHDFSGELLQKLPFFGSIPSATSVSSFFADDRGVCVLAWIDDFGQENRQLAQSLDELPDDEMSYGLVRMLVEYCENTYVSPEWWDSIAEQDREALVDRMSFTGNPTNARLANALRDDGIRYDSPKVIAKKWVGYN